jgi:hypothetical protein
VLAGALYLAEQGVRVQVVVQADHVVLISLRPSISDTTVRRDKRLAQVILQRDQQHVDHPSQQHRRQG